MKPLRIGLKYCGGCAPRFDRVAWVAEFKQRMAGRIELLPYDDPNVAVVLVVTGCKTACADISAFAEKTIYWISDEDQQMDRFIEQLERLEGEIKKMNVIVDLCVVPLGVGVSVSPYVAACQKILQDAGLSHQLHAYGTNIEGPWDQVFAAIKKCHEEIHGMGAPRISTTIKLGTRTDRTQTMTEKVASVTAKL